MFSACPFVCWSVRCQGFIQTPRGVITPWFLCNTPSMYTAKRGYYGGGGVNQDWTFKSIIDKRLH